MLTQRGKKHTFGNAQVGVLLGVASLIVMLSGLKMTPELVEGQPWQHVVKPGEIQQFVKDLPGMSREDVVTRLSEMFPMEPRDIEATEGYLAGLSDEELASLKAAVVSAFEKGGLGGLISELSRAFNGNGPIGYPTPGIPALPTPGVQATPTPSVRLYDLSTPSPTAPITPTATPVPGSGKECCFNITVGGKCTTPVFVYQNCPFTLGRTECMCSYCSGCIADQSWWWDVNDRPEGSPGSWDPPSHGSGTEYKVETGFQGKKKAWFAYNPLGPKEYCLTDQDVQTCFLQGLNVDGWLVSEGPPAVYLVSGGIGGSGSATARLNCAGSQPSSGADSLVSWSGIGTTDPKNGLVRRFGTFACGATPEMLTVSPGCSGDQPRSAMIGLVEVQLNPTLTPTSIPTPTPTPIPMICRGMTYNMTWKVCSVSGSVIDQVKLVTAKPNGGESSEVIVGAGYPGNQASGSWPWSPGEGSGGTYKVKVVATVLYGTNPYTFESAEKDFKVVWIKVEPTSKVVCACDGQFPSFRVDPGNLAGTNVEWSWFSKPAGAPNPPLSYTSQHSTVGVTVSSTTMPGAYTLEAKSKELSGVGCSDQVTMTVEKVEITPRDLACLVDGGDVAVTLTQSYTMHPVQWRMDPSNVQDGATLTSDGSSATVSPGSVARAYTIRAESVDNAQCFDEVNLHVIGVTNVQWQVYMDNTAPDTCPKNGGKRMFPDKKSPTDPVPNEQRQTIRINATISPALQGQTVYFKLFDADDPSSSSGPIDNNDSGGPTGGDNWGVAGFPIDHADTIAGPHAFVDATVSMKPGDNYKAAASCNEPLLTALTQAQIDQNQIPNGIAVSEMLTVWRKLNVEVDSMGPPPPDEPFGMIVGTSQSIGTGTLTSQDDPQWATNKLEGAVLNPSGSEAGIAINHTDGTGWEVISNTGSQVYVLTDYSGDSFDNDGVNGPDDPGEIYGMTPANPSNLPFAVNTDDPKWLMDLQAPSAEQTVVGLNAYFDDVYIECVEAEGNTNPTFDFERISYPSFANAKDVESSDAFWVASIAWCYESKGKEVSAPCPQHNRRTCTGDDDPEDEGLPLEPGNRTMILGVTDDASHMANVYVECARDRDRNPVFVAAHEIGHILGLDHATYVNGFEEDDRGLMSWKSPPSACPHDWWALDPSGHMYDRFSNNNICELRNR